MTQDVTGPAGQPSLAPIPEPQALRESYLEALTHLSPHFAHDLRGRMGAMALHLDLAGELLAGSSASPGVSDRVRVEVERARAQLRDVVAGLETLLSLTVPATTQAQRWDARDLIRDLEAALAPAMRERKLEWGVVNADPPAFVHGAREALRQSLLIAAVEILVHLEAGSRLELTVTSAPDQIEFAFVGLPATHETSGLVVALPAARASV
jgi:hypothetical protein